MFDMKILVAARHAWGDQLSGLVSANIRAQAGSEGMTLKSFGKGPDLYFCRNNPNLLIETFVRTNLP